jgi:hypothetical protein
MQRIFLMVSVLAVALWMAASVHVAQQVPNEPRAVGAAGMKRDGTASRPTRVGIRTNPDGKAVSEISNASGVKVSDFHVELGPRAKRLGYKITDFQIGQPSPFDSQSHDDTSAEAESTAVPPQMLDEGDSVSVMLEIEDKDGNPVENTEVDFTMHWTRFGVVVSNTSNTDLGGEADVAMVSVIPNYSSGPAQVQFGTDAVTCHDIALGETFGYRFQNGSLVVSPSDTPSSALAFEIDDSTRVKAYDENGDDVTGSGHFSASNLRIDDAGNFVFDVARNTGHDKHIVIVVRDLRLIGMGPVSGEFGGLGPDEEIHAGISGAAVSGGCFDEAYHLVTIVE